MYQHSFHAIHWHWRVAEHMHIINRLKKAMRQCQCFFFLFWRARQVNRSRLSTGINNKITVQVYCAIQATESQLATQFRNCTLAPVTQITSSSEKVTLSSSSLRTRMFFPLWRARQVNRSRLATRDKIQKLYRSTTQLKLRSPNYPLSGRSAETVHLLKQIQSQTHTQR